MENQKKQIILVPSDFTEVADFAINHAIGIAKILNYSIVILHVVNNETKSQLKKDKQNEDALALKLGNVCKELSTSSGIKMDFILKEGSIFSTIAEVAEEIGTNLIVMGTHGKKGVQHIMGSYALKVITSSSIPFVIVQKRAFNNGYKNLVFPLDSSVESKQKVKWAANIAKTFGAKVHIFCDVHTDEFIKRKLMNNINQVETFFQANQVEYTIKYAEEKGEKFAKQTTIYAEQLKAELIVIMTNNDQFMPGSIFNINPEDEKLVFNTEQIPVLCINPVNYDSTTFRPY